MLDPLLEAEALGFRYGNRPVLSEINLRLEAGSCSQISGDNGAGKSTLLHLLQGRLQPTSGCVLLNGRRLKGQRRRIGLVPQQPGVRWHYPIHVAGMVGLACGHDRRQIDEALAWTGLSGLAQAPLATLSGGQRQRVLIARALTSRIAVLLLDEPLSNLDQHHRTRLGLLMSELCSQGITVVFTAHGDLPATLKPDQRLLLNNTTLIEQHQ